MTVQGRMLELLSDNLPHSARELHACLEDELGSLRNINPHLSELRRRLECRGENISCCKHDGTLYYSLVRIVRIS